MKSLELRLDALETRGGGSTCEIVCVQHRTDERGLETGEAICAEWRNQRFERQGEEQEKDFLARVRSSVGGNLSGDMARSLLFLHGSDCRV